MISSLFSFSVLIKFMLNYCKEICIYIIYCYLYTSTLKLTPFSLVIFELDAVKVGLFHSVTNCSLVLFCWSILHSQYLCMWRPSDINGTHCYSVFFYYLANVLLPSCTIVISVILIFQISVSCFAQFIIIFVILFITSLLAQFY